tara:strand:- start:580 stop:1356 length:777 start_codon:yes stop_codon:yes gene_type:complete
MFKYNLDDKKKFIENGYVVKKIFGKNNSFIDFSNKLNNDLIFIEKKNYVKNLGGYRSGNLNIDLGIYSEEIINLLLKSNFSEYFNYITGDNIDNFEISTGGNLNLPGSKKQLFHTDGNWSPRMIIVNIAPTNININNGPIEILEKSHIRNLPYWKFLLDCKKFNPKKIQLDLGDVLIREHRLWHRGTRNNSNKFREMVGVMLIKKENTKKIKEYLTKPKLYSNMFDNNLKGKLLEFIFLHFKILLVIYKLFLSLKSKQ